MSAALKLAWLLYFSSVSMTGVIFHIGLAAVRLEHLGIPLLFLLVLKLRQLNGKTGARCKKHGSGSLIFLCVLWVLMALIVTVVRAPEVSKSLWILVQISVGLLCYNIIRQLGHDQKKQLVVSGTRIVTFLCAVSITGFFLIYFAGIPSSAVIGVSSDLRLVGLSFEPNIFASQIVGWLAVVFYWRAELPKWRTAATAVMLTAIVLAGTRAAWLALIVLAAWWLVADYKKRPVITVLSLFPIAIFGAVLLTYSPSSKLSGSTFPLLDRFLNILDTETGTGAYRLQIYDLALRDISASQRWLFGSGLNTFSQYNLTDPTNVGAAYLSSIWWALLYDVGLMGLALFIIILVSAFFTTVRRFAAFPAFAVVLICASTTNLIWFVYPWLYWALLGYQERLLLAPQGHGVPYPFLSGNHSRKPRYIMQRRL